MKSITHLGLLFTLGLLLSPATFAERPADFETEVDTAPVTTSATPAQESMSTSPDGGRPAAYDVKTETRTSGDVMNMPQAEVQAMVAEPELMKKLDFPRRGMKQEKVQQQLGRPIEIIPAVGKPPISRWVYDDRIVYFEYTSVIHVVAR